MKDFLTFRKMITPWLVQFLFWAAMIILVIIAIIDIIHHVSWRVVFEIIILGPLAARIISEVVILFFRMNDNLTTISEQLRKNT